MTHTITIKNLSELKAAAQEFIEKIGTRRVCAFYGEMGAGKTTFIKALCEVLSITETVTSPTFAIINEYHTPDNDLIYHFDFYRIKQLSEAYDFGCEDYFYSGKLCLIEWAELVEPLLPEDAVKIVIDVQPDGSRIVQWTDS